MDDLDIGREKPPQQRDLGKLHSREQAGDHRAERHRDRGEQQRVRYAGHKKLFPVLCEQLDDVFELNETHGRILPFARRESYPAGGLLFISPQC